MIVVSDTSPLNYLILINAIDVLPALFREVFVPPAVIIELTRVKAPAVVQLWASSPPQWVKVVAPSLRLSSTSVLDEGEAEALSLAKELHIPDILIDERRARKVAEKEGLRPLPTLAIIELAATQNLIDLPSAIQSLQQTTIRVPAEAVQEALQRDSLRKQNRNRP